MVLIGVSLGAVKDGLGVANLALVANETEDVGLRAWLVDGNTPRS
jgi:hypothetical protein